MNAVSGNIPAHLEERSFQLLNKTNQFNLNGIRLSQAQFAEYVLSKGVFYSTLSELEVDYGLVSVILFRRISTGLVVDSWVVSCRVFNRRFEAKVLLDFLKNESYGARTVSFQIRKTERNTVSTNFFQGLKCFEDKETAEISNVITELSEIVDTIYEEN